MAHEDIQVVALFDGMDLAPGLNGIQIADGISLSALQGTPIEQVCAALCEKQEVNCAEPFVYSVFAEFHPAKLEDSILAYGNAYSHIDRFANIVTIFLAHPVGMCRVLWTRDAFTTLPSTRLAFSRGDQTEFLERPGSVVTSEVGGMITTAWQIQGEAWSLRKSRGRLVSALTYFYYSWRSDYVNQICINLVTVLDQLFAPHSQFETSHEISHVLAQFMGVNPEDKKSIYRFVKRLYALRSQIVHGGLPDDEELIDPVVEGFSFVASVLKKILIDRSLARTFDNDLSRRRMIDSFLFG